MSFYPPEYLAAEVDYRRERLTAGRPHVAPQRAHGPVLSALLDALVVRFDRRHTHRPVVGH